MFREQQQQQLTEDGQFCSFAVCAHIIAYLT